MADKSKVLIVDDDPDLVESVKLVLQTKYEVITASDGDEGLKKAREENPDLVILDVIMPVKDGFTAAEQIKKDEKLSEIPVIMLTSYGERKSETSIPASKGMTLEAEDYIEKPFKPEDLLKRVEDLL
ncbi:MAG: response regulator [Dehalococcoidia bacterium]